MTKKKLTVFEREFFCCIFMQHQGIDLLTQVFFAMSSIFTAINEDVEFARMRMKIAIEHNATFFHQPAKYNMNRERQRLTRNLLHYFCCSFRCTIITQIYTVGMSRGIRQKSYCIFARAKRLVFQDTKLQTTIRNFVQASALKKECYR